MLLQCAGFVSRSKPCFLQCVCLHKMHFANGLAPGHCPDACGQDKVQAHSNKYGKLHQAMFLMRPAITRQPKCCNIALQQGFGNLQRSELANTVGLVYNYLLAFKNYSHTMFALTDWKMSHCSLITLCVWLLPRLFENANLA